VTYRDAGSATTTAGGDIDAFNIVNGPSLPGSTLNGRFRSDTLGRPDLQEGTAGLLVVLSLSLRMGRKEELKNGDDMEEGGKGD
jgi:hypothetical protein